MAPTVYLVSGANRGIGLGLVQALARRADTIVFAGARNPSAATELQALANELPGIVHIVKLIASDEAGNRAAAAKIKEIAGRLDVVIANAAISAYYGPTLETPPQQMIDHFEVNTVGVLVLFQAMYPLMKESALTPKFVVVSSAAGTFSFGTSMGMGMVAYGASKAAVNYLARKLHFEHEGLVCFLLSPGAVDTDLAADALREDKAMQEVVQKTPLKTVREAAAAMLQQIEGATREQEGGQFVKLDGSRWDW